jgi:hypothetical protein
MIGRLADLSRKHLCPCRVLQPLTLASYNMIMPWLIAEIASEGVDWLDEVHMPFWQGLLSSLRPAAPSGSSSLNSSRCSGLKGSRVQGPG